MRILKALMHALVEYVFRAKRTSSSVKFLTETQSADSAISRYRTSSSKYITTHVKFLNLSRYLLEQFSECYKDTYFDSFLEIH